VCLFFFAFILFSEHVMDWRVREAFRDNPLHPEVELEARRVLDDVARSRDRITFGALAKVLELCSRALLVSANSHAKDNEKDALLKVRTVLALEVGNPQFLCLAAVPDFSYLPGMEDPAPAVKMRVAEDVQKPLFDHLAQHQLVSANAWKTPPKVAAQSGDEKKKVETVPAAASTTTKKLVPRPVTLSAEQLDRGKMTLFVSKIPPKACVYELCNRCQVAPPQRIQRVLLKGEKKGESTRAQLRFKSHEDASVALKVLGECSLADKKLQVEWATYELSHVPKAKLLSGKGDLRGGKARGVATADSEKERPKKDGMDVDAEEGGEQSVPATLAEVAAPPPTMQEADTEKKDGPAEEEAKKNDSNEKAAEKAAGKAGNSKKGAMSAQKKAEASKTQQAEAANQDAFTARLEALLAQERVVAAKEREQERAAFVQLIESAINNQNARIQSLSERMDQPGVLGRMANGLFGLVSPKRTAAEDTPLKAASATLATRRREREDGAGDEENADLERLKHAKLENEVEVRDDDHDDDEMADRA
jgi:hypothetical protein